MRIKYKRKIYLFVAVFLLIIIILINGYLFTKKYFPGTFPLNSIAAEIIARCQTVKNRLFCYEKEIPPLMDPPYNLSMEKAFEVSRIIQLQDDTYIYCHVLGHTLSGKEAAKDLSAWGSVIKRCPTGVCSNGCIHGAFMEKFKYESLSDDQIDKIKPELKTICHPKGDWQPTGMEQNACHHALGHLLMYLTNADIKKSLKLCRELSYAISGESRWSVCFNGAFMQIFQPLEPEDRELVKKFAPSKDTVYEFCSSFDERAQSSCWIESWPLWLKELKDPSGMVAHCSKLKNNYKDECYSFIFYIMPIQFKFNTALLQQYCSSMPEELRGECAGQVTLRLLQTNHINSAADFCKISGYFDKNQRCYELLIQSALFNFHRNSKEFSLLCESLPYPWKEKCLDLDIDR